MGGSIDRETMKVRVIDENGTAGIIRNDLSVESEEPIAEEIRRFMDRAERSREGRVTLDSLGPSFLVDLYVEAPVSRVEPASAEGSPAGDRWDRVRPRYSPPTCDVGEPTDEGSVRAEDEFAPNPSTQSPSAGGAGK